MANFTTYQIQFNSNTDASPTWQNLAFGGSSGANQLRWCASGAGAGGTGNASWPPFSRPGSAAAVPEAWGFASDASGIKVATYDGNNTNSRVFRVDWDNLGTYASAPQVGAFGDNTHTAPSPGTQPGAQSGSPIVNGSSGDTGSTSYLKANFYGQGVTSGGAQQTPAAGSLSTPVAATDGTAGAVTPGSAAWIATHWQSLQGFTQYVLNGATPAALTAGDWYFTLALFVGPNMSTGRLQPVLTVQYSFS